MAYTRKMWQDNELITTSAMNNIETGIEEALAQTTTITDTAQAATEHIDSVYTSILGNLDDFRNELAGYKGQIET